MWNSIIPFSRHQIVILHAITSLGALTTVLCALVIFFWFCRMRRRFRHEIIMMLIVGGFMRALMYVVLAVWSFTSGAPTTGSAFCLATGTILQFGTVVSDWAALFISLQTAMQLFRPFSCLGSEGLYRVKWYVYGTNLALPSLSAGLAYINPNTPYESIAGYCVLPIRPYWYRLALLWIPRYLIGVVILALAFALYFNVQWKLTEYETVKGTNTIVTVRKDLRAPPASLNPETFITRPPFLHPPVSDRHRPQTASEMTLGVLPSLTGNSREAVASDDTLEEPPARQQSVSFDVELGVQEIEPEPRRYTEELQSPRSFILIEPAAPIPQLAKRQRRESKSSSCADQRMTSARNQIRSHLRKLFIYPIIYFIWWLLPFILHCLQYQDRYARRPPYALAILDAFCRASMGAADCVVFAYRERPWQLISGCDGTLWGSFMRRDYDGNVYPRPRHGSRGSGLSTTVATARSDRMLSSSRRGSRTGEELQSPMSTVLSQQLSSRQAAVAKRIGSGTGRKAARDVAYTRLALERAARLEEAALAAEAAALKERDKDDDKDGDDDEGDRGASPAPSSGRPRARTQ